MASVRVTGGTLERRGLKTDQRRGGAFYSAEDKVPAPGVGSGTINITTDVSCFAGGTATGGVDHYTLEDGTEGHEKQLLMGGTGEAVIDYNGTATRITLTETDERVGLVFIEGKWRQQRNVATATAAAAGTGDPHYVSHDITHVTDLPTAAGTSALAMGDGTTVNGSNAFAIGTNASATGSTSIALGKDAEAGGAFTIAIGDRATADFSQSIAIGQDAETFDTRAVAIGDRAQAGGKSGIAIGTDSDSGGDGSIAMGNNADALAQNDIAIGTSAEARGTTADSVDGSIVIGAESVTTVTDGMIFGPSLLLGSGQDSCTRLGGHGALFLPRGTTAQRPPGAGATDGQVRFNTSLGALEYFTGSTWKQVATA